MIIKLLICSRSYRGMETQGNWKKKSQFDKKIYLLKTKISEND